MTAQIEKQTDALKLANRQLEERRGFIEAVLESVSAGIISIDREGRGLADEQFRPANSAWPRGAVPGKSELAGIIE